MKIWHLRGFASFLLLLLWLPDYYGFRFLYNPISIRKSSILPLGHPNRITNEQREEKLFSYRSSTALFMKKRRHPRLLPKETSESSLLSNTEICSEYVRVKLNETDEAIGSFPFFALLCYFSLPLPIRQILFISTRL
jgi:hypothetical protein